MPKQIKYEFAIKKQILVNNTEIYTPVVRVVKKLVPTKWERIICLYGEYMLQELDFTPKLTYKECEDHITGYQQVLYKRIENSVKLTELHTLEQKQL